MLGRPKIGDFRDISKHFINIQKRDTYIIVRPYFLSLILIIPFWILIAYRAHHGSRSELKGHSFTDEFHDMQENSFRSFKLILMAFFSLWQSVLDSSDGLIMTS